MSHRSGKRGEGRVVVVVVVSNWILNVSSTAQSHIRERGAEGESTKQKARSCLPLLSEGSSAVRGAMPLQ